MTNRDGELAMTRWIFPMALTAALAAGPATAQNCKDPQSQIAMNHCAWERFQVADRELNAAYKKARVYMRELDSASTARMKGAAIALRDAQRAWIPFRDKACESDGFRFRGGTMEPLVVATCKTRLTQQRTRELLWLIE
jgi:uncharacterized protein YecT (DUF1311 family)